MSGIAKDSLVAVTQPNAGPSIWRKLLAPFREFGWAAGAVYIADRALRALSPRCGLYFYELMAQPVPAGPLLPARRTAALQFVEIVRGDADVARMPARPEVKVQRFDQGARCLGVRRGDELIGYLWLAFGRHEEDEVRCTYALAEPARSAFDFDVYLFPEHRQGIAFAAVWQGANDFLRARGLHTSFSRMTRFNLASRRAHARLGARCIGRALFLQLGTLEAMAATLPPYVALGWTASQRVVLRLHRPAAGPVEAA
jgi:hypothetical protein